MIVQGNMAIQYAAIRIEEKKRNAIDQKCLESIKNKIDTLKLVTHALKGMQHVGKAMDNLKGGVPAQDCESQ